MERSLRIRRATAADIPAILDLERHIGNAAHWSQRQYDQIFLTSHDAPKRVGWIAEAGLAESEENASSGAAHVLGFLVSHRIDEEWELENIAVGSTVRRQGVGARLLGEFITHARAEHSASIFLEVRESNLAARALYRKLGFEETGLRKSYYSDPPEAAILCRLGL